MMFFIYGRAKYIRYIYISYQYILSISALCCFVLFSLSSVRPRRALEGGTLLNGWSKTFIILS